MTAPDRPGRAARLLFVAPSHAVAADTGGGQRTRLLYEALCDGYAVDVLIVDEWGARRAPDGFDKAGAVDILPVDRPGKRGLARLLYPFNASLADTVSTALHGRATLYRADHARVDPSGYDAVVARYLRPAARAGIVGLDFATPALIDIDDRDDQVLDARLAEASNPAARAILRRHRDDMREIFRTLTKRAAHLWVATAEDAAAIDHPSVSTLPNIPFSAPAAPPPPAAHGRDVLFVGSGGHRPNVEGLLRFASKAWPSIREQVPDASLRIVGSGPWEKHAARLRAPGVSLIGRVDDLSAEYARARFVICPVFEGGGSKIKVLEAFAHNRAVVSAAHSARGYDPALVEEAIFASQDETGMAAACVRLLNDPEEAARRAARGCAIVAAVYSRQAFSNTVQAGVAGVLAKRNR